MISILLVQRICNVDIINQSKMAAVNGDVVKGDGFLKKGCGKNRGGVKEKGGGEKRVGKKGRSNGR